MQQAILQKLKDAQGGNLEVDLILDGGTAYPRLIAQGEVETGVFEFMDSEHASILLEGDMIRGAVVSTTPPAWYIREQDRQKA